MKRLTTIVIIVILAAIGVAVFVFFNPFNASTVVKVELWDAGPDMVMVDNMRIRDHADRTNAAMGIKATPATMPAGKITFNVTNSSKDIVHEMIVAVLKDPKKGLVYDASTGRVNEDAPGMHFGEVSELDPGKSGSLTLQLKPGTYALYCNVPAHYASGMWTTITVK